MTQPQWNPYDRGCPTRQVLDLIGDRWTVLVVGALDGGPLRFSEVASRVDGVSQKMLTQTLRRLEHNGLVTRTQYPEIPPRVVYELTPTGHTLRGPLKALEEWATAHIAEILAANTALGATGAG